MMLLTQARFVGILKIAQVENAHWQSKRSNTDRDKRKTKFTSWNFTSIKNYARKTIALNSEISYYNIIQGLEFLIEPNRQCY